MKPLTVTAHKNSAFELLYNSKFNFFIPTHTHVFNPLYKSDHNIFIRHAVVTLCVSSSPFSEFSPGIQMQNVFTSHRKKDWWN